MAFEDTYATIDRQVLLADRERQMKHIREKRLSVDDLKSEVKFGGSVAVAMALMPSREDPNITQVFIAHVGDCRAVLSDDGVATALTEDHKASNKHEKLRVEDAGGWISNGRVSGALVVTRAIGDIQFKNFTDIQPGSSLEYSQSPQSKSTTRKRLQSQRYLYPTSSGSRSSWASVSTPTTEMKHGNSDDSFESLDYYTAGGLWSQNQHVISKPDFKQFTVEPSHEFVILASDGLWDVFQCQEAVNFVRKQLFVCKDLHKAARALIDKAIERGTQDNTSCVICAFHQDDSEMENAVPIEFRDVSGSPDIEKF